MVTMTLTAAIFKLRGAAAQAEARPEKRNARRFIAGKPFARIYCVPCGSPGCESRTSISCEKKQQNRSVTRQKSDRACPATTEVGPARPRGSARGNLRVFPLRCVLCPPWTARDLCEFQI